MIEAFTNQNYYEEKPADEKESKELKYILNENISKLTLKDITDKESGYKNIVSASFNRASSLQNEDSLIFEIVIRKVNGKDQFYLKTGLFAGEIRIGKTIIRITPAYGENVFFHMLCYVNNIFVSKNAGNSGVNKSNTTFPLFKYLFLLTLQKAAKLGFPKAYRQNKYYDVKVHGGIDLNEYIKKDNPFTGKLHSKKNERDYVQEIIDVILYALNISKNEIQTLGFTHIGFLKSELKDYSSGKKPSYRTIEIAKHHSALNNPMYRDFKKVLDYAELVIKQNDISKASENNSKISGYLLDISALWEAYLAKVLRMHLPDWEVHTQEEILLYEDQFYSRPNYPDFVLIKNDEYVILDAKFKKMDFLQKDVDRSDLFQIHSYAGYYNLISNNKLKLCGLIYPLSERMNEQTMYKYHSQHLYGVEASNTAFIVDGIYLEEKADIKTFKKEERAFCNRLKSLLNK